MAVRLDDLVLRFPRSEFARECLRSEIGVLELLERSDHATPEVVAVELSGRLESAYLILAERAADARVVRRTFHLQDALYGARQGDWSYVDDVLAAYG